MMKGKYFYTNLLCSALMFICAVACSEDLLLNGDKQNGFPSEEGMVSAVKQEGNGEIVSRSAFKPGAKYSIAMFTREFEATETSKPVLSQDSVLRYKGLATETLTETGKLQYLVIDDDRYINNDWLGFQSLDNVDDNKVEKGRRSISFYGFTYGEEEVPVFDTDSYKRTESVNEKDELKDLMWGILVDQNDATAKFPCEIPFTHAFSRLEFKVSQLESDTDKGRGMYDLGIESIAITGTYRSGVVDVFTGKTKLQSDDKYENGRILSDMAIKYDDKRYINVKPDSLGAMIVFPSADESIEGVEAYTIGLEIILKGEDEAEVEKLVGEGNAKWTGNYYTGVYSVEKIYSSVYDGNVSNNDGSVDASPLYLQSGSKYTLQIVLMEDEVRVVTVVPSKVEWIPGENVNGNSFATEAVGQPVFFDNTMWMDRNLGANAANPETDYNKTIGYYYQNNRNIPYWPYKLSTFNNLSLVRPKPTQRYLDELTFSSWDTPVFKVYPVIDEDVMDNDPINDHWRTGDDDNVYKFMNLQKDYKPGTYIYFTGSANIPTEWESNSWEKRENQPAPPGWALPTREQFQSIFPSTVFAGNITFLKLHYNGDDWIGDIQEGERKVPNFIDENINKIRICVPFYKDGTHSNEGEYYDHWADIGDPGQFPDQSAYYDNHSPFNYISWEPDGDPSPGYCSVYILSREEDDKGAISNSEYKTQEWGTIYGIKKVGTTEAYRMRWKVRNADVTSTDPRLYIEVNMYSCTKDDNLTLENYKTDYDWNYPVSQMFIPLCGQVEGRSNQASNKNWIGSGYSSYGSAVLYATSTGNSALHIKITGDNPQNQYMSVVRDEIQTNAKQIRLVKTQN